jgi:HAD superfamily hydrolase (TIGR01484 family)
VRPLDTLPAAEARRLAGIVFDLDDTVLDHGALGEAAYGALFRLREAGLRLVACTGRPAGWGDVVQRQWPIDATVTENGAVAFGVVTPAAGAGGARQIEVIDTLDREARHARREGLLALAAEILQRFPRAALADDNDARRADVTLDIGEHRRVPADEVRAIRAFARARGVRTFASSIHLHLTHDPDDKATGTIRLLVARFGEDATSALGRWAFVGDSANDAAAFAAFRTTFGVGNVRSHLRGLTVPPRYVAPSLMGRGFAEIAGRLVALRASAV